VNCCWTPVNSDGAGGVIEIEVMGVDQNSCPPQDVQMTSVNIKAANNVVL
jgi:hypothetical protein